MFGRVGQSMQAEKERETDTWNEFWEADADVNCDMRKI